MGAYGSAPPRGNVSVFLGGNPKAPKAEEPQKTGSSTVPNHETAPGHLQMSEKHSGLSLPLALRGAFHLHSVNSLVPAPLLHPSMTAALPHLWVLGLQEKKEALDT